MRQLMVNDANTFFLGTQLWNSDWSGQFTVACGVAAVIGSAFLHLPVPPSTHTHTDRQERPNMAESEGSELTSGGIFQEIFTSPLNLTLLSLCLFLLYKIFRGDKPPDLGEVEKPLPRMKKRDFTLADLKPYDGEQDPRILMAVNGKVFDVTRGKKFYGPGNDTEPSTLWRCYETFCCRFFSRYKRNVTNGC